MTGRQAVFEDRQGLARRVDGGAGGAELGRQPCLGDERLAGPRMIAPQPVAAKLGDPAQTLPSYAEPAPEPIEPGELQQGLGGLQRQVPIEGDPGVESPAEQLPGA